MTARALMVQGTSSSVGKSLLTAALCRLFARQGIRVAPFKAQNMSNNAAVCRNGAEIGRAQAVQAAAAGIEPTADMNPVLLKPEADARCQVIVEGRPWKTLHAGSYYRRKDELWPIVTAALDRLRAACDLVIIEGAGSPVELNLTSSDIVNMAIARHAWCPVLLVGDIDRGGIFAQLLGTLWLLPEEERALVHGLIVNKFRGDPALFADGVGILEERGKVAVLGVVPFLAGLTVPEEDAVALDAAEAHAFGGGLHRGQTRMSDLQEEHARRSQTRSIDIAIMRLPRIANFDDFDPLRSEPGVCVRYVADVAGLGRPDAIIVPGTKSTLADFDWLNFQGLTQKIRDAAARGTAVVGICGGYQMLGTAIRDPKHVESAREGGAGLGLLPVETVFEQEKATYRVRAKVMDGPGWLRTLAGHTIEGFEIHMGRNKGGLAWLTIVERNGRPVEIADGAVSPDGKVWGCYLHGLFADDALRRAWLNSLAPARGRGQPPDMLTTAGGSGPPTAGLEKSLDDLADAVERALDMARLKSIMEGGR
jgi:adenosylcobyric acid synthase